MFRFFHHLKIIIYPFLLSMVIFLLAGCQIQRDLVRPNKNLSKEEPPYYEFAANYYYNLQEYDKAIFQYEQLIEKFSDRPRIYEKQLAWADYEIGFIHLVEEDYDLALAQFDKVITKHNFAVAKILAADRIDEINKVLDE